MNEAFQFDVFLSHSSKDKAVVRSLADRLRADGLRVWFDESEIRPGDSIPAKIEEGLEQSRVLVLCMSVHAFGSEWAQLESHTFRFRDPLNKDLRFIPIRLDNSPPKGSLAQFLYVNWLPEDRELQYPRLLEACKSALKTKAPIAPDKTGKTFQVEAAESILTYAFSADGKRALYAGQDRIIRHWDLERGRCLGLLEGHRGYVAQLRWGSNRRRAASASGDGTVRLWDIANCKCTRVFESPDGPQCVAWSADERYLLSGSFDSIVRLWDAETGRCLRELRGHDKFVLDVAFSPDQKHAISGSMDNTIRLWALDTGECVRVLEGHTAHVLCLAWGDDRHAVSGGGDNTVRLWDIQTGRCLRVLEGHTELVRSVGWSPGSPLVLSGSNDHSVRVWNTDTGRCLRTLEGHAGFVVDLALAANLRHAFSGDIQGNVRSWNLSVEMDEVQAHRARPLAVSVAADQIQYTNAKVVLVGQSGAGKTGLTERLVHNLPPQRGPSTSGAWSTQWSLKNLPQKAGWEREVWLWDFGGQSDQRLIHQLYLDRTALVLLMFDSDEESVLPRLREWQQALAGSKAYGAPTLLVAGRTDVGMRYDREKVRAFARESAYEYFETSSDSGAGISELRNAMLSRIPWSALPTHNSPALFKQLKDEILKLRDEGQVLTTFKELESLLRLRLPAEVKFADAQLETVVTLLDGPGLVKELGFGTYILLRPEWINTYAQAVIRTLRSAESGLGCLPVSSISEGKLIFQTKRWDGKEATEKRLGPADEKVVLQAMEQMLLERRLCLRQNGDLVFPSHCGLERPVGPVPQKFFVSYTIRGFLDDIYTTLVVKLAHCGALKLKQLWREAADFETLADARTVGIKLLRGEDGRGELLAHHAPGVTGQEQVIFATYIHEHLREKSTEEVPRLRFYTCPHCDEPVENRKLAMERLEDKGEHAEIRCQRCDKFVSLWDALEKRFASAATRQKVEALRAQESSALDSRRQAKLLVLEASARITSANQTCYEIPGDVDEGIDLVIEFTDVEGRGTGKHMYAQLKAGNSFLKKRKADGVEIFAIKKQRWVKYWASQDGPVMLVIGTFPEESERSAGSEKKTFAEVRWMEVGEILRRESDNGKKPVKQLVFNGERLDAQSVRGWRDKVLSQRPS